jgi:BirA family biotin operon repressor/biotin-[acetyl-CoA-carboxylase] ligase
MNFESITPVWLDETDSTNAEAMRMLKRGKPMEGSCVAARYQSKGRGQRSNVWNSLPGENLLVSFILYPPASAVQHPFLLSKSVALAVQGTLRHFTQGQVQIKWPNDILIDTKKAAGILIENQWLGSHWSAAVVGIGINVNQKEFKVEHATSLASNTMEVLKAETVLTELQTRLSRSYRSLCKGDREYITAEYHQALFGSDRNQSYLTAKGQIEARVIQVFDDGRIEMLTDQGFSQTFDLSELRLIY